MSQPQSLAAHNQGWEKLEGKWAENQPRARSQPINYFCERKMWGVQEIVFKTFKFIGPFFENLKS